MTKVQMTHAEFMETIAQSPKTKVEIIARIETEIGRHFAQMNERNEKTMLADGCPQEVIDFVREHNEALLQPTVLQALHTLGINLAYGPERKQ
jgi:hypothetical protein